MDQDLTQYVDSLFTNMENFTQNDGLIGKPVTQGDKTFLPVMSITFGFGGGDSSSKLKQSTGGQGSSGFGNLMGGGALGLGAKLSTDAVLIIDNNNLLMAPIGAPSGVSQMIEKIPQILSNMNAGGMQGGQQGGGQQGGTQGQQGGQQGGMQ